MTDIQIIVAIITGISCIGTFIKIREKHTSIQWNIAPFGIGFTSALWIALIFGG